ncbi:ATP-binding protein [uncultured Mucilaginibacter sp.]|uniref:ATP-binding protein n=1 Tax=uncultured Mucilaginibacter sp. TaxID=797541 RepID=UPI0025F357CB|nr:ATP-binding protein [uncultured Mucilaginibacter sp.]
MQTNEKAQIIEQLRLSIKDSGLSNNKFAVERLGITGGMISQVLNDWQKKGIVGENTWNIIIKYLNNTEGYKLIPTENFKKVCEASQKAYENKVFIPLTGERGYGKTAGLEWFKRYQESNKGYKVFYVNCEGITTRKQFLSAICTVLNIPNDGTIKQQVYKIKQALTGKDCLLLIDEVSSLQDYRVTVIKDLMTALKGICGIVFAGTPYFMMNLIKGANKNKHLFSETLDRLFFLTYELTAPNDSEAEQILKVNGLSGEALDIVMGRNNKPAMKRFAWHNKPTFRGISDCLVAIRIALCSSVSINYPSVIA